MSQNGVYENLTAGSFSKGKLLFEEERVLHLDDSLCSQLYGELFRVEPEEVPRTPGSCLQAFKGDAAAERCRERQQKDQQLTSEDEEEVEEEDDLEPPADEVKEEESVVQRSNLISKKETELDHDLLDEGHRGIEVDILTRHFCKENSLEQIGLERHSGCFSN